MADRQVVETLKVYFERLKNKGYPVVSLVLYGSHAREDTHEWSDIDVIAVIDDSVPQSDLHELWTSIEIEGYRIDNRIETVPVYQSAWDEGDSTPLIYIARKEGIPIAA